jgi:hypothetical protein
MVACPNDLHFAEGLLFNNSIKPTQLFGAA